MTSNTPRRRKVTVGPDEVVDAAIEIANRDGLDALSIRTIAAALDIGPMSVYRFVESKDDLVEAIVVRVMDRLELPQPYEPDWRDRVVSLMTRWRDLLVANPCVVQVMSKRRIAAQPEGLARLMEGVLGNLETAGLDPERAVEAFWQIFTFTFGHVVFEMPRAAEPEETDTAAGEELAKVAAERGFDRVARAASMITATGTRLPFERSLRSLLTGIAAEQQHP